MTSKELETLVKDWVSESPKNRAGMLVLTDIEEDGNSLCTIEGDPQHVFIPIYKGVSKDPEMGNKVGNIIHAIFVCMSMPFQLLKDNLRKRHEMD